MTAPDEIALTALVEQAREAALGAYAPYSNFRVGAALLTPEGTLTGANVENASYGLGICAERVAIAHAVAGGHREFVALAVACIDAQPGTGLAGLTPCGACRQWFLEFAPDLPVLIARPAAEPARFTAAELLPNGFRLD
ncbi:cytidine deaminase [Spongisporangium articulatum]|uniref:Cytidine deaminase n=1 Tax=Spongisporangium articulatum TaxID=3362603 RepID=A0ABW8AKP8_9ACTN